MTLQSKRELQHAAAVYDPQKAHEYYLRNRRLKGHKKVGQDTPQERLRSAKASSSKGHSGAKPGSKSSHQHNVAVQQRVDHLKKRLDQLHKVLAELVKQAKARSGVETKPHHSSAKSKPSSKSGGSGKSTKTVAQKKADANKARAKYHKEHPGKNKSSEAQQMQLKIADVEAKIKKYRAELKAATKRAREHAHAQSKTAPKGR